MASSTEFLAPRFAALFRGLDRAHGTYVDVGRKASGKMEIRATTIREGPSDEHWRAHLRGERPLGTVPIRDDATAAFGAIDIDEIGLDLAALAARFADADLPLVVCRSKSGGAHAYLFLDPEDEVPASLVRDRLGEFATFVGYPGAEVFPKQSELAGPRDVGNWINLPYYDAARTTRYAVDAATGSALDVAAFVERAERARVDAERLAKIEIPEAEEFPDGPPCLQALARLGVPEGSRNNALFDAGVYARKRSPDSWESEVWDLNRRLCDPPLADAEVKTIVRSLARKAYEYLCSQPPIASLCNRSLCRRRAFGVGAGTERRDEPDVVIDSVAKVATDPPIYYVTVNGVRIEMDSATLISQSAFGLRCVESVDFLPAPVKPAQWRATINALLAKAETIDAPVDASRAGHFASLLEAFCTERASARERAEVLQGKPYHDAESGRTYFRASDLSEFLVARGVREKPHRVWALLRDVGAEHAFWNVKGRGMNVWSVPTFDSMTEPYDVPRVETDDVGPF